MEVNGPIEAIASESTSWPSIYENRKRLLLEINFGMVIVGGICFIAINYGRGLYVIAFLQAFLCLLFFGLLITVHRQHALAKHACWVYVLSCMAFSLYAFWEPRSHPTTFSWAIMLIFITMIMLGQRPGRILCFIYVPMVLLILWWKHSGGDQGLPLIALANFTVLYVVALIFAIFSEHTRTDIENQLKQANQSLESMNHLLKARNADLKKALAEVKTLSGFLPICAACKKIRDDKGYWNQVEAYIQKHTRAQFSHSVCPECARELYPGLDLKL